MKKLKIAYYTEVNMDANDGPAVNETEFVKNLKDYSDNKFLFVTGWKNESFCRKNKIKNSILLPTIRMKSLIYLFILYLLVIKKIISEKTDILVCRLGDLPLLPFLYKLLCRNRKLAIKTAAFWYIDQEGTKTIFDKIYQGFTNFLMRKVYQWADIVDTALPNSIDTLIEKKIVSKDKIKLIDNGVNTEKFSIEGEKAKLPIFEKSYPILGFMGSFPFYRGAKQALEVARRIKHVYPNVAVMILGWDDNLSNMIEQYKKDDILIYAPGIIPYEIVEKYVRHMTIGFSFYEPWTVGEHGNASQKVRQYLSCGKPVFSTYHNHQFLVDNHIGSIFNGQDYEAMANAALQWLSKIEKKGDEVTQHIRDYAVNNLSCNYTFSQRIHLYHALKNRIFK